MSNEQLDYAGCAYPVEGLGPGRRVAMWVRGCQRRCAGCIAPELWKHETPIAVKQVAEELLPFLSEAEGLTISGGEPFDQAGALASLLDYLRSFHNVEVLVYTGYTLEELAAAEGERKDLLDRLDILIDGPFIDSAPNTLQWRGSDNQRVHLLSERVQRYSGEIDLPMPEARPLQIQMLSATRYRIIGLPRRGDIETYRAAMAERGLKVAGEDE